MNKKGFTLFELLAVIIIIALLSGIGIVSFRSVFTDSEKKYYSSLEQNLLLAGNDYFEDHRSELPTGNELSSINLEDLIDSKYIDQVNDAKGNSCSLKDSKVYIQRQNKKYKYGVCLICEDYQTGGEYCDSPSNRKIHVKSRKVGSSTDDYDVLKSYNSQEYSDNKNIQVTFSMSSNYSIKKYITLDVNGVVPPIECDASHNSCTIIINKSGSYKVSAYDNSDNVVSSIYISAKIPSEEVVNPIAVPVEVPLNLTSYCNSLVYNGSEQVLTKTPPANVTFVNNVGTNATSYTVLAHIDSSEYVWSDGTVDDIPFTCDIEKASATLTCANKTYTGSAQNLYSNATGCASVTNGSKTDAGTWTLTCVPEDNYTAPSTCNATINKAESSITCKSAQNYTGSAITTYSASNNCGSITNGSVTDAGTYTVTCNALNNNYSNSTCEFTLNKVPATLTCVDRTYTGSAQNLYSNATGCASVTNGSKTDAGGPWTLTCVPDDNHTAPSTCTAKMNKVQCNAPTGVTISTAGKVSWTASSNCSSAQHQISIDGTNWTNASKGVDYNSTIVAATGSRKVYVRAVAPNSNYTTSSSATATATVYSVTLTKHNSCSNLTNITLSGAGNYIKNATVTISASFKAGYTLTKWTVGSTSTVFSTNKSVSFAIDGNKTYRAVCAGCRNDDNNCGDWYNSGYHTNDGKGSGLLGHNFRECVDDCETLCKNKYSFEHTVKYWSCTSYYEQTPTRAYQTKDYCYCSW